MGAETSIRPTNLHVAHSWGGGLAAWVDDFTAADPYSQNLVLESRGTLECYGIGLTLRSSTSGETLDSWVLRRPISEMCTAHEEYTAIVRSICERYAVSHLYVSSLLGHSHDVLRLGMPVTLIYHDYTCFCPALYITRDGVCSTCTEEDLRQCRERKVGHRPKNSPNYYVGLRDSFFEAVASGDIRHVVPSGGLASNLRRLDRRFEAIDFNTVEHGINAHKQDCFRGAPEGRRLRVGVLGNLLWHKGLEVFRRHFDTLRLIADVHFIGCQDSGSEFAGRWGSRQVPSYPRGGLGSVLARERLDLALFVSLVPESFSFTLSEAWSFCIPPAARRIGAHASRIQDGHDGFLFGLEDDAVVDFLLWADRERDELRRVSATLRDKPVRTTDEALGDYYRLRSGYPGELRKSLHRTPADIARENPA